MAQTKTPAAAKPAAAKAASKPAAAPKAAAKTTAAKPETSAGAKVKLTQIGSPIRRAPDQEATLIGLGLNKMHKTRVLEDTKSVRGMIAKVAHMLKVETVA